MAGMHADGKRLPRLSRRQAQVALLVASGKTNRQIGVELGLSEQTVKAYVHNSLNKFQLRGRSALGSYVVMLLTRSVESEQ